MKLFNKVLQLFVLVVAIMLGLAGISRAASNVNLGTAGNFAILAGSTVTNTGASVINGDLGLSPGTSITGFPPGTLNGTEYNNDATAAQAQVDLTTAYNDAAGQTPATTVPTELGGTTKTAGIYNSADGTFEITGTLTLNGQGDPSAVFVFKIASTLITAGDSKVVLINSAQACHVFWQVGTSATLGTNSDFKGNILALTSATLNTGANVEGRVLARNAAVTLDTNVVTEAVCTTASPTPSPSPPPVEIPPLINVMKVPTPLALPAGPGLVTYDYTVLNVGTVAMSNITVTDNKCANVGFISGDTNSDSKLDISETWKYRCTTTLLLTTLNTVIATGQANGFTATDTANATVVVGVSSPPPLIHLIKKPDVFVVAPGGTVTYTYTVTNPGTAALDNLSVVDDKCSPVSGPSGDINENSLLEPSETWTYTCRTNLTVSTINIATAEGSANGLTAIDFSPATVVIASTNAVTSTRLPTTGAPKEKNIPWNIIILFGIDILAFLILFYFTRRKQTD